MVVIFAFFLSTDKDRWWRTHPNSIPNLHGSNIVARCCIGEIPKLILKAINPSQRATTRRLDVVVVYRTIQGHRNFIHHAPFIVVLEVENVVVGLVGIIRYLLTIHPQAK